jgi:hypothetical protein
MLGDPAVAMTGDNHQNVRLPDALAADLGDPLVLAGGEVLGDDGPEARALGGVLGRLAVVFEVVNRR